MTYLFYLLKPKIYKICGDIDEILGSMETEKTKEIRYNFALIRKLRVHL
jgi:hypothetical protein